MRIFLAIIVLLLFRAAPAAADLYRWIDPESGAIKYSSYPPPWYGDETKQRRAPKVEHIPARSEAIAKPETPGRIEQIPPRSAQPETSGKPQEGARKGDAPPSRGKPAIEDDS